MSCCRAATALLTVSSQYADFLCYDNVIDTAITHHSTYATRHPKPRKVVAASAINWLAAGWKMFAAHPLQWMLMALAAFVVMAAMSVIMVAVPIIGPVVAPVLFVLLTGGMLSAAQRQADGETIRFIHLLDGLSRHTAHLSLVGVFYSVPLVLMSLITVLAVSGGLIVGLLGTALGSALNGLLSGAMTLLSALAAGWFVSLIVLLAMILALIYAPALIMFRDIAPLDAMIMSLRTSLYNLSAMLLFGTLLYVLFMIALVPAGLGVLILIPVSIGALRQAYLDIFGEVPPTLNISAAT